MNQREKDFAEAINRDANMPGDFADGAEYARKELFARLIDRADVSTSVWLEAVKKEYGL